MCFSKPGFLVREQRTLAYQFAVIIRDVIRHIVHVQFLCELAREIFRQRLYFKRRTPALKSMIRPFSRTQHFAKYPSVPNSGDVVEKLVPYASVKSCRSNKLIKLVAV